MTFSPSATDHLVAPLAAHAAARGEAPALHLGDDRLTWAALHAAVESRACEIAALPPGGVALRLTNSVGMIVLVLAAARAGREAQVLDPAWPAATAATVLARLAPAVLIGEHEADRTGGGIDPARVLVVPPDLAFADWPQLAPPVAGPLAAPDPGSAFYVGFTSGSTGMPKGYRRSQRSWVASFLSERREFAIGPSDVVAAPGHFTHSLFLYAVLSGLHAGATVLALPRFRPEAATRLLREGRATVLWGVPTQIALVVERAERAGETFDGLRLVLASGAKWPERETPRLAARAPNALFAEFYGASELSFVALARRDEDVPPGSVGRPFVGVAVTIRDRTGRRLPRGRRGLVHVVSDFVFMDYACGDEDGEACLRFGDEVGVGDAGFLDARGFLHLCGRWKRMIVTSGKNVFPEEVERVADAHPSVAASAVLGLADTRRGERLAAVVALGEGALDRADLVAWCRARLAAALVPTRWYRLAPWPQTASGKTDFPAVARAFARGEVEEIV